VWLCKTSSVIFRSVNKEGNLKIAYPLISAFPQFLCVRNLFLVSVLSGNPHVAGFGYRASRFPAAVPTPHILQVMV
jgi:hypothetical protein